MYKILYFILFCNLCLSCKMVGSNTTDVLYKGENGIYYYAWPGEGGVFCTSSCIAKPTGIEEALTELCNGSVRYSKNIPSKIGYKLNLDLIFDVDRDIAFLHEDTVPPKTDEEKKDVIKKCLSDDIIQKVKRNNTGRIDFIGGDYKSENYRKSWGIIDDTSVRSDYKNSTGGLYVSYRLSRCNSCPLRIQSDSRTNDPTFSSQEIIDAFINKCSINDPNMACFTGNIVAVKPVKKGLTYKEAEKYCQTPYHNNYVIDWEKVNVGYTKSGYLKVEEPVWIKRDGRENNVILKGNSLEKVAEDSKDVYTLCLTSEDNLRGVYIYRLEDMFDIAFLRSRNKITWWVPSRLKGTPEELIK